MKTALEVIKFKSVTKLGKQLLNTILFGLNDCKIKFKRLYSEKYLKTTFQTKKFM